MFGVEEEESPLGFELLLLLFSCFDDDDDDDEEDEEEEFTRRKPAKRIQIRKINKIQNLDIISLKKKGLTKTRKHFEVFIMNIFAFYFLLQKQNKIS